MIEQQRYGKHAKHAAPVSNTPDSPVLDTNIPEISSPYGSSIGNSYTVPRTFDFGPNSKGGSAGGFYASGTVADYGAARYVKTNRRKSKRVKHVVLTMLALVLCYFLALGVSGFAMYKGSDGLMGDATSLQQSLLKGDYGATKNAAASISKKVGLLNKHLSSPLWAPATIFPVVGQDIQNARVLCSSADNLCSELLNPMVDALASANTDPIIREDSSLNADALQICFTALGNAEAAITTDYAQLSSLKKGRIGELESACKRITKVLGVAQSVAAVSSQLAERVHWLLGAEGEPRTYLIVAQNNVEIRATGGYPGSLGPMYIENGKMDMGDFVAVTSLGRFDRTNLAFIGDNLDPAPITEEEFTLFGKRVSVVPGDMNYNPSFARAAESWQYTWEAAGKGGIDGVIGVDPVFLQILLGVVGGVTAEDGTVVDGQNAGRLLMYDTYRTRTSIEQDEFFAEVAHLAFDKVTTSLDSVDLFSFGRAMWNMGRDKRLLTWFSDNVSQYAFDSMGYTGKLPDNTADPYLGVYFNDDTWSKMFWYLSAETSIGPAMENPDGSYSYIVTTTLKNNLSEEEEEQLPDYVVGDNWWCRTRGDMISWIYLVAPKGGSISNVYATGFFTDPAKLTFENYPRVSIAGMNKGSYDGLDVWYGLTQMNRGESTTVTYTVTTSPNAAYPYLGLYTTPTAQWVAGW